MFMNQKTMQQQAFFTAVSSDMFQNGSDLFEQIDAQFTGRSVDESVGAQMAAFCVYVCGLFSTYLCLYPTCKSDQFTLSPHYHPEKFELGSRGKQYVQIQPSQGRALPWSSAQGKFFPDVTEFGLWLRAASIPLIEHIINLIKHRS